MDQQHIYYDKFRVAFIQANEEAMHQTWEELRHLPLRERIDYLEAFMKIAKRRAELGLFCVFERRCDRCLKPKTIQEKSDDNCSC